MGDAEAEIIGGGRAGGNAGGGGGTFGFKAKAVVVSAFVPVIGGSVSPGPRIVDVTPEADPSSTVS
jgi:hypothetical protein